MDNYLPADFHALRAQVAADWRDESRRSCARTTERVEYGAAVTRWPYADRSTPRERSDNDCIDPGWQSL